MVPTLLRAAALSLFVLFTAAACSSSSSTNGATSPDGGVACGSCAEVYTNGGVACGPGDSSDAWQALALCACGVGPCASACHASFCASLPADETCGECLFYGPDGGSSMNCKAQLASCAAN